MTVDKSNATEKSTSENYIHENASMSYENPNYGLDDALNCNTPADSFYHNMLYQEFDNACSLQENTDKVKSSCSEQRKMGMDIVKHVENHVESNQLRKKRNVNVTLPSVLRQSMEFPNPIWEANVADVMKCASETFNNNNQLSPLPDESAACGKSERMEERVLFTESLEISAVPLDLMPPRRQDEQIQEQPVQDLEKEETEDIISEIENEEDAKVINEEEFNSSIKELKDEISLKCRERQKEMQKVLRRKHFAELEDIQERQRKREEFIMKRRSIPVSFESELRKEKGMRFDVRSFGWVEIAEEELIRDQKVRIVNKCIADLASGRIVANPSEQWTDGINLVLHLDEVSLKVIDPDTGNVLNTQLIHTIRLWGSGRECGR